MLKLEHELKTHSIPILFHLNRVHKKSPVPDSNRRPFDSCDSTVERSAAELTGVLIASRTNAQVCVCRFMIDSACCDCCWIGDVTSLSN